MQSKKYFYILTSLSVVFVAMSFVYIIIAPKNFPVETYYEIKSGTGLSALAEDLVAKDLIKSKFLFKAFVTLLGETVKAGDYRLDERESVITLASRFTKGDFKLIPIRLTIPEGFNLNEIATLVSNSFLHIKTQDFLRAASSSEGYLFPDTYLFLPNTTADSIVATMKENFSRKIQEVDLEIKQSGRSLEEIIKMASILELEARTMETRQMIADILWRRLSEGMPLQVDASFKYINGKNSFNLTLADLKIDSPYNSYVYRGLPPTPLGNPGLGTIKASLRPIKNNYVYFLTDNNGVMHYSRTYAEHLQNKRIYLE